MSVLIRNGRLIDPANGVDRTADLYIDDGSVTSLDRAPEGFTATRTIDASGMIVCPGLIDLRARLREPGQEHKATMAGEIDAAAAGGITTLSVPPDTFPPIDTPAMAQMIQQRARQIGKSFVHPVGALTQQLEGTVLTDMAALGEAGCAGVGNALNAVRDTVVMRRAMQYASTFDLTVFLHAHDPWLQGNGCVHEGEISTRLGLPAIPEAAETVGVGRDLALMETTGARCHFNGLSTARSVDMIARARQDGIHASADVTAHHLHLTEHDIGFFNTQCHVIPPLRSARDRERLIEGIRDGTISAVCSDHQPHEPDAKLAPFSESESGISGLETLLPLTLRLVADGVVDLPRAVALLTMEPARILGIDAGHLGAGAAADVCIFDPQAEWTLDSNRLVSRGRNTPFHGWPMTGRVRHTLVGGEVVYSDEK
ncbi:MAG: dihydroorotase [Gammaproteobacteria bacterium]|nr:dihydroorotase [Gammaproteobacteria bacterium]